MRELVGNDPFEFLIVHQLQQPVCHRHRRVLWIAARGEGVRRLFWNYVELRHGEARLRGEAPPHLLGAPPPPTKITRPPPPTPRSPFPQPKNTTPNPRHH